MCVDQLMDIHQLYLYFHIILTLSTFVKPIAESSQKMALPYSLFSFVLGLFCYCG